MLVLTRPEVIDVRRFVTVAEITTQIRGLVAEVVFDHLDAGLDRTSAINCDGLHTVAQSSLTRHIGSVDSTVMLGVCRALNLRPRLLGHASGSSLHVEMPHSRLSATA